MTEIQSTPLVDLVHIRPGFPGESERIDEQLEATGLRVAVFSDVYRGLARLMRLAQDGQARAALRAVFVQIDDLGPPEMEFFSLTSRVLPRIPVLVYGSDRHQSLVQKTLDCGATDRVSPEVIARLTAYDAESTDDFTEVPEAPAPVAQPVEAGADLEPPAPVMFPKTETMPEDVRNDSPPPVDQPEDETATTTRVPWLKYENRPARQAPRRVAPQPTSPVEPKEDHLPDEVREPKGPNAIEPLLTEQELRALLGDDISSIAPADTAPNGSDQAEERGER